MVPAMKRLLIEGAELYDQDCSSVDRLMLYVDNNLSTLNKELNEENFNRILEIVWDNLDGILKEIVQSNLEVSKTSLKLIYKSSYFLLEKKTTFIFCKSPQNT